ncbi:MAG TPA: GGDEF domain-containing phosphodiesterase, partial [Mycobacteriales bacterium]|nr:GGDEF domain-containing phosphodiesterase [Mycobacteriales bacterium]
DPFLLGEQEVRVATSIGIATTALGNTRAASLVRDADAAMYRAKARGRACTEVFDARLRAEVLARLRLENDLRQAVESDALEVRYQPQVDFGSGLVVGVEALVRWPHPEHGLLLPAAFVSLADETGLAADLGRLVLRRGCAEAAHWLARWPHRRLPVGVNVSARQLADARFVDDVAHALAAAHLPADRLCLEVTQPAMLADEQASAATLERLHALGVRTALDDFGVGYSSLSHLKQLRLHALKVDRAFVHGLPAEPRDLAIVASVVALGAALGLEVVAEGVETSMQADLLRGLGCRVGQGHLWSGPVPADELAGLLDGAPWGAGTVDLTGTTAGERCG